MSGILTQVVDGNWTDHAVIKRACSRAPPPDRRVGRGRRSRKTVIFPRDQRLADGERLTGARLVRLFFLAGGSGGRRPANTVRQAPDNPSLLWTRQANVRSRSGIVAWQYLKASSWHAA